MILKIFILILIILISIILVTYIYLRQYTEYPFETLTMLQENKDKYRNVKGDLYYTDSGIKVYDSSGNDITPNSIRT